MTKSLTESLSALLFELLVELLAQGHRGVHPDLYGGVEVRDVLLGLGHPLADDPHHPGRLDELRPWRLGRLGQTAPAGSPAGPPARAGPLLSIGLTVGLLRRPVLGPLRRAALHRGPHVALDDAARRARAVDLREVEVVLLRQPAHYRGGPELPVSPAVGLPVSLGGGLLLGFFLLGLRGGLGLGFAAVARPLPLPASPRPRRRRARGPLRPRPV